MWVPNTPHLDLTSDTTQRGVWPQRGCALGLSLQSAGRLVRNREPCESSVAVRKSSMEHHSSGQPGCSARLPKREPFPSSPVLCFQNIGFWRVFFFFFLRVEQRFPIPKLSVSQYFSGPFLLCKKSKVKHLVSLLHFKCQCLFC